MNWWKDKRCIFILIITTLTEMNESSVLSEEARLQQNLFNDHNPDVHPVLANKTDRAVHVMFDVQLIRILDVNERDQFIKTYVWINQYWHNPFLTWNPVEYSGISAININPKKVWVPDILLYNNVDEQDNLGGGRETYRTNVALKSDGTCTWMNPVMFKSICKIDVTYFPFDDQQCDLKFGSWSFDKSNIDMITNNQTIINKYFVANGEWNLKYIHSQRNEQYYQCCVQPFVDITVTLRVSRTSQDYLLKLVLPCSLISSMVFLVFILPPESGERIGLSITILLAMTVFQQLSSEIMPSYGFPLLGQYYFATMFELGMALLVTTVVLNIYHRRNKPMPLWFRVTVLICLKKVIYPICTFRELKQRWKRKKNGLGNGEFNDLTHNRTMDNEGATFELKTLNNHICDKYGLLDSNIISRTHSFRDVNGEQCKEDDTSKSNVCKKKTKLLLPCGHVVDLESTEQFFDNMRNEQRKDEGLDANLRQPTEETEEVEPQWHTAARILDRFFFIVAVIVGVATFFGVFLKSPGFTFTVGD